MKDVTWKQQQDDIEHLLQESCGGVDKESELGSHRTEDEGVQRLMAVSRRFFELRDLEETSDWI